MIKKIYQCDRCGRRFSNFSHYDEIKVIFAQQDAFYTEKFDKRGHVCKECSQAFIELAESFFDDLNKENNNAEN